MRRIKPRRQSLIHQACHSDNLLASIILLSMLKLIETTPTRTVFVERRPGLRWSALAFITVSVFALAAVLIQLASAVESNTARLSDLRVIVALALFLLIGAAFVGSGLYALLLSRTMTLTLDRKAGEIVIVAPRGLSLATERLPYYGVKSVRLTGNETQKVIALVFVLRDGRVVPVTAAPVYARETLEQLADTIRGVLEQPHHSDAP